MKKLVILLVILTTLITQAQEKHIFTVGVDSRLLLDGAYEYDHSSVWDVYFSAVAQVGNNEVGVVAEYAELNPYYWSFGFMYNRLLIKTNRIDMLLGAEVIIIQRGFLPQVQREFIAYGLNATTRFYLLDYLSVNLKLNAKYRTDLVKHYNSDPIKISGYVSLSYIIERW